VKILLGYFNVKVGRENIFKPTIGNENLHEISNDNGARAGNVATSKHLVVKSIMFPHRKIHKYTWTSSKGNTHNQIDHVLIDRSQHSSTLDVRSFRGADCDNDPYLVVAKVRERLAVSKQAAQKVDTERFNDKKLNEGDVKEQYQVTIRNTFAALEDLEDSGDINGAWDSIRENLEISAQESLGYCESKHCKLWFDEECSKLADLRKQAKLQWLQDPSEASEDNLSDARREASRHFSNKKRKYLKDKINELESNSKNKNIRDLYSGINEFKKGYQPRTNLVNDERGDLLADLHKILNRWKNYFCQLLNLHGAGDIRHVEMHTAEPSVPEATASELEIAIGTLKRYKSQGVDQIPAELIRVGGETLRSEIHKLIKLIWKKEELPHQWKESIVVPIHKKGNKTDRSNYQGISLLSTSYKILSNILLARLTPYTDEIIGDHQCGFRRNRSMTDQIFYIRQILEKKWEYNGTVHQLFIDFKKAYDSVRREVLYTILIVFEIPRKPAGLFQMCLIETYSTERIGKYQSDKFSIQNGLKQGDVYRHAFQLCFGVRH
jgi:hypothetical protein